MSQDDENPNAEELREELTKLIPKRSKDRYVKLVDKMLSGTVMAAIRLKCLDCSYYQEGEIRNCNIKTCPLWPFRLRKNPFRKKRSSESRKLPWLEKKDD